MRVVLVALALVAATVFAGHGGDISEPYDSSVFKCTKDKGWDFVIVRSYCSNGAPDPNAKKSLDAAKEGGIKTRDVYHFPCRSKDPKQQVKDDIAAVGKASFDGLWFDIETNPSPGCGWSADHNSNCDFLSKMIESAHEEGVKTGVYASQYMWSSIMGDACRAGSDHGSKLWYAHYDHTQSFSDYQAFGGWTKPDMKQYWDGVGICGISADADWQP